MPNYLEGKIYKICSVNDDHPLVYIGSTTQTLRQRMRDHRKKYNHWKNGTYGKVTVFELFIKYSVENCRIELLEDCPCESSTELFAKERAYIQANVNCVNKHIPNRSYKEYCEDNKQRLKEQSQLYYTENKTEINRARSLNKFECSCGSSVRHGDKSRHFKTEKHINFIAQNVEAVKIEV